MKRMVLLAILAIFVLTASSCYERKTTINYNYYDSDSSAMEELGLEDDPNCANVIITLKWNDNDPNCTIRARLLPGQRTDIISAQKKKIDKFFCLLRNAQNSYYSSTNAENTTLKINNVLPGVYMLDTYASRIIENKNYNVFEAHQEVKVTIKIKPIKVCLFLQEWQPIMLLLSEQYEGEKEVFGLRGECGKNSAFYSSFLLMADQQTLIGEIPLGIKGIIKLQYDDSEASYKIDSEAIINSLINDQPVDLSKYSGIEMGFQTDYIVVPNDFDTIQEAIDNRPNISTLIKIEPGIYYESIVLNPGTKILGDIAQPQSIIIKSDEKNTIMGKVDDTGLGAEISGITIVNNCEIGELNYSTAAVFFELGFNLTMDHCIVESFGIGECIVGNYNRLTLSNITIFGNAGKIEGITSYTGANTGIALYNTSTNNRFENLIFYKLLNAVNLQESGLNPALINVEGALAYATYNCSGIGNKWISKNPGFDSNLIPSAKSEGIKEFIERFGSYPGAIMPR